MRNIPGINETCGKQQPESELRDLYYVHAEPEFDRGLPQNVSAIVGKTAFLTCVVRSLKPTQKVRGSENGYEANYRNAQY